MKSCIDCGASIHRGKRCKPCNAAAVVIAKRDARRVKRESKPLPICEECKKEFTPAPQAHTRQKYCSDCRGAVQEKWRQKSKVQWQKRKDSAAKPVKTDPVVTVKTVKPKPPLKPRPYFASTPNSVTAAPPKPKRSGLADLRWATGDEAEAAARFAELMQRLSQWGFVTSNRDGLD